VAIQCSDCGAILEAEAPGETRKPCACGSTARTHEQSAAAIVSTSSVSAAVSVERGLNDTRLAVLGIIVAIGLTVGFGVDGAWFVRGVGRGGARARDDRDPLALEPPSPDGADVLAHRPVGQRGARSRIDLARLSVAREVQTCGEQKTPRFQGVSEWARLGSNQRPLACEASALPLSYAPEAATLAKFRASARPATWQPPSE
jgi:hypothetical protein